MAQVGGEVKPNNEASVERRVNGLGKVRYEVRYERPEPNVYGFRVLVYGRYRIERQALWVAKRLNKKQLKRQWDQA